MATLASHADRSQRHSFGRVVGGLVVLGVLLAAVLVVPTSWFENIFSKDSSAAESYTPITPAEPVRVSVASIGLAVPLIPSNADPRATLDDPPVDAPLVTWWQDSAKPGVSTGQTVLIGHADGAQGALTAIAKLHQGDQVDVLTKGGTMAYEIDRVRTLTDDRFGRAQGTLFKQDGGAGRLVMISRQGWDGSAYSASVVVTGVPLGQPSS